MPFFKNISVTFQLLGISSVFRDFEDTEVQRPVSQPVFNSQMLLSTVPVVCFFFSNWFAFLALSNIVTHSSFRNKGNFMTYESIIHAFQV